MDVSDKVAEIATVTVGGALAWLWTVLTGRVSRLEASLLPTTIFDKHVLEQNAKFEILFARQEKISDKLSDVHAYVSRIEGIVSGGREDKDGS